MAYRKNGEGDDASAYRGTSRGDSPYGNQSEQGGAQRTSGSSRRARSLYSADLTSDDALQAQTPAAYGQQRATQQGRGSAQGAYQTGADPYAQNAQGASARRTRRSAAEGDQAWIEQQNQQYQRTTGRQARTSAGQSAYDQRGAYGSQGAQQGAYGQQAGAYGQQGAQQGRQRRSAYDEQGQYAYAQQQEQARQERAAARQNRQRRSAYSQQAGYQDDYQEQQYQPQWGQAGTRAPQDRVYAEGRGRAYTSSRGTQRTTGGAVGVRPVSRDEYVSGGSILSASKDPGLTRRQVLIAGGSALAAVALLGIGGAVWWTHRAVACEINGTEHEVPIGSTAQDLINKGYASPSSGNLVSIADADGNVSVLEAGAGNRYTLVVNDQEVDVDTYRVSNGDVIQFVNGTDLTEEVTKVETTVPCGIQVPDSSELLNVIGYVQQWGRDGVSTVETGTISGITVDRGVTTEAQDLIIAHAGINPADGRKLIALTFDDGPSLEYTPQYLDILARYGARATFFNLGLNLEEGDEYVALCKRCVDEGHQVASHTYSHNSKTLSGFDEAGRNTEISKAFTLVSEATGVPMQVMRPPYGEFRGYQFLQYLKDVGDISYTAYWGVDSLDWENTSEGGAATIVTQCTSKLTDTSYNGAVILMHDGGGDRTQDVIALPQIIEAYQARGYELVTLNEMLAADGTFPEWVVNGYVERPDWAVIPDISAYIPQS